MHPCTNSKTDLKCILSGSIQYTGCNDLILSESKHANRSDAEGQLRDTQREGKHPVTSLLAIGLPSWRCGSGPVCRYHCLVQRASLHEVRNVRLKHQKWKPTNRKSRNDIQAPPIIPHHQHQVQNLSPRPLDRKTAVTVKKTHHGLIEGTDYTLRVAPMSHFHHDA